MDRNIFAFIWRHSKKQQIYITFLTFVSFPFLYYSLELPKIIVNEAIGGAVGFPVEMFGLVLEQVPYLLALSGIFLALVFVNGGFKYYINVYRGQLGERMLRRLRYDLYTRVLRFRLPRFKRTSQGEIIPMITGEVEPLGGFVGDAFGLPAFQGGTLLVYLVFIFVQDPILGAAAISLYPVQAYIIPKLQKRVNQLGKQRVRAVRQLSDRIGETVSGVVEIHASGTASLHQADTSDRLGKIFDIRYEIFRRKFFIKFLNNFLNQLTPFFFYSIGGYLVIAGDLTFGALVAVLAAYKDLSGPWRELLNYYQRVEDIRIKYTQVIEQFQPEDIMSTDQLTEQREFEGNLPSTLVLSNVVYAEDVGLPILDGVSVTVDTTRHIAVLGDGGSGKDEMMMLLARLLLPTGGRIRLGDLDYTGLPESITGRRIAYVGPSAYIFTDTLRANLYYGLMHRPGETRDDDPDAAARQRRRLAEALASGNTVDDIGADWINYQAAGATDAAGLQERALEALRAVDMEQDVYRMGLSGTIDPQNLPDVAAKVLQARAAVRDRLGDADLGELVEPWDADRYNESATVAENLLFGTPVGDALSIDSLADHPYVLDVLMRVGLTDTFLDIGAGVAETMIELFGDLAPGHELFEQFSFISSEDLPVFQPMVARMRKEGTESLRPDERSRLMSLPFKLVPSRHRLGLIDDAIAARLLEARRLFAEALPDSLRGAIEFFDVHRYNAASTLQDNILFGKTRYGQSGTESKVQVLIGDVVDELSLRQTVIAVGLDHSVGVAGARLSSQQRQKLALARAVLKRPDLTIINQATATLDGASQQRVFENLRRMCAGRGLIWAIHRPSLAKSFDTVIVLKGGKIAGQGGFEELFDRGTLTDLLAAE